MQPLKETKVYIPNKEKMSYFTVMEGFEYKIGVDECTGYFLTKQEMLLFKRQFALEVLNKAKDTDINTAWHNIKKELQSEFENKLLNNE